MLAPSPDHNPLALRNSVPETNETNLVTAPRSKSPGYVYIWPQLSGWENLGLVGLTYSG